MSEAGRLQFFERCPWPAAVLGRDGRVEAASPAWERLVGWSPDALVGRPLLELLHPAERHVAAHGLAGTWGARAVRPDGSTVRLVWTVAAGPDGRHFCVARQPDADERRRQERFRLEFINLAAHALNTPLTPIQLALDTLEVQSKACLPPEARQTFAIVQRNFARLRDVVGELLDSARLQAGRLPLDLREADLSALAAEAVDAQRQAAAAAGVRLRSRIEPGLRGVVDARRLGQALGSCLACALASAPADSEVRVELRRAGREAALTLAAPEAATTEAQCEGLFLPFPPHEGETPPLAVGSGLGLYLARGILELHGGRLGAGRGEGLRLEMALPLEGPPEVPQPRASAVGPLDAGTTVH